MKAVRPRALAASMLALAACLAQAQEGSIDVPAIESEAKPPRPAGTPRKPDLEGAIGLVLNYRPEYQGSSSSKLGASPGFYIRWRRFTFSNQGGFATRDENEDVQRGVDATLIKRENLRMNFTLRYDPGRSKSKADALKDVHSIPSTVRGRLAMTWRPAKDWQLAAGWSNDLLGRKSGGVLDLGLAHEYRLSRDASMWIGTGASWADERYMRAQFGITPEDTLSSGYPVYHPGAGMRDVRVSLDWRQQFGKRWVAFAGTTLGRMLGPTVDSPLTTSTTQWGMGGGLAWRF